jgi:hypothetical protein
MTTDHRPYRHTQFGWVTLGTSLVILPLVIVALFNQREELLWAGLAMIALIVALFGWLTIEIDERRVLIRFGAGLIRRSIPLNTIRAFAPVTNRWYYGWGVRFTPHGMLYNVSGFSAVEILLEDGRHVRVGTDEPQALSRALEAATRLTGAASPVEFPKDAGWSRRIRLIGGGVAAFVIVWISWMFYAHTQPPSVELSGDRFEVASGVYSIDLRLSEVAGIALVDALPRVIARTNGFAARGLRRGHFRLEGWGSGRLFINSQSPPYIVVRTADSFVVVNFEDAGRTRELYGQLTAARSQKPATEIP